jgi:hypothetical protein
MERFDVDRDRQRGEGGVVQGVDIESTRSYLWNVVAVTDGVATDVSGLDGGVDRVLVLPPVVGAAWASSPLDATVNAPIATTTPAPTTAENTFKRAPGPCCFGLIEFTLTTPIRSLVSKPRRRRNT